MNDLHDTVCCNIHSGPSPSACYYPLFPMVVSSKTGVTSDKAETTFLSSLPVQQWPPTSPKDPSEIKNYRLVSLLSFLSKTIEHAVFNQLSLYLHQNNLQDPHQSGFKVGPTETALLAVTEMLHAAGANSLSPS